MHSIARLFVLPLLPLVATPAGDPVSGPAADDTGRGWRGTRLELDVHVDPHDDVLVLEGVLHLSLVGEPSLGPSLAINGNSVNFEFERLDAPPGARVRLNQEISRYPSARLAEVRFPEGLPTGSELELEFSVISVGESSQLAVDPQGAFASWTENWYPIPVPDPDLGMRQTNAMAGVTRFHLPEGWSAVSNGRWLATDEGEGLLVQSYEVDPPVARSFAAGPYTIERQRVGEREIAVALLPESRGEPGPQSAALAAVLGALETRFGPYPYPSYAIAEVPEHLGEFYASSEQGFIMVKPSSLGWPDGNLALYGHELAHGWFGNLVGTRGPGSELNSEGLCQLASYLAIESIEDEAAATDFLRFSRPGYSSTQCARGFFQNMERGGDRPIAASQDGDSGLALIRSKSQWVLTMLRRRVGDETFFGVLRGLIEEFAGDRLSVDDLRGAYLRAAPEAGLERFFEQWLDRKGAPRLELEWSALEEDAVAVTLRQEQEGKAYALDLEIDVVGAAGTRTHVVTLEKKRERFELPAEGEVTSVILDPRHRVLRWTPEYE